VKPEFIVEKLVPVFQRDGVRLAALFGSTVRDTTPRDIDNVCRHFLAVVGVSLAELDTTNLIELAGEKGLLESSFAQRIRGMTGMRNAIVHAYWRLDYQAIYRVVTQQLTDFDEFARQVQSYMARQRNRP